MGMAVRKPRKPDQPRQREGEGLRLRRVLPLLLLIVFSVMIKQSYQWFCSEAEFPIEHIEVTTSLQYADQTDVANTVRRNLHGNFFNVDIAHLQSQLEAMPWIDKVQIRRVWPGSLQIAVIEQKPIAHWGQQGFLNYRGESFVPAGKVDLSAANLPRLSGPEGHEKTVLQRYMAVNRQLLPFSRRVIKLVEDERQSWQLQLDNGLWVKVGRQWPEKQMSRFLSIYAGLIAPQVEQIENVDMRYSNGLAIAWKGHGEQNRG